MAYINIKNFDIIDNAVEEEENLYFECDELIAPTIRLLNLKGYKTEYCCQSHPYPGIVEGYIIEKEKSEIKIPFSKLTLYYLEEVKNIPKEVYEDFKDEIEEGFKVFLFRCKENKESIAGEAYIAFAEGYEPESVPEGWCKIDFSIIKYFDVSDNWKYFEERLKELKKLYEWAENLPSR